MFWKILCVTNSVLNIFVSVVLGMVVYKVLKQAKKKNAIKNASQIKKGVK